MPAGQVKFEQKTGGKQHVGASHPLKEHVVVSDFRALPAGHGKESQRGALKQQSVTSQVWPGQAGGKPDDVVIDGRL